MSFLKTTQANRYEKLLYVRLAELLLAERYKQQEMRTPTHFGVGQEAVAVGVCDALMESDVVFTHHRSHNHYLAKGGSFYKLAAELFGREDGCSKGRGGSVHLTAREVGFIASSAILGETIAAATGAALSFKMDGQPNVSVSFFGDAAAEEGILYECMNYAALHKLPVLFVCENNGYATESPLQTRQPEATSLCERAKAFNLQAHRIDGNNLEEICDVVQETVAEMKEVPQPYFIECETYRWLEHVGPHYDYELNRSYRSQEELEVWQKKCPVKIYREKLLKSGFILSELNAIENRINDALNHDLERAYHAPWPKVDDMFENVY